MDERIWNDIPLSHGDSIALKGATITRKRVAHSVIISGDISKAIKKLIPNSKAAALGEDIGTGDHAIRIGRDTVLINTSKPLKASAGWDEAGYAISHADGKYTMLELTGEHVEDILAQGASIAFKNTSPSAAIEFAGLTCLLVKQGAAWVLFVERPMLTYISSFLSQAG